MTAIYHETLAAKPDTLLATFTAFGLWLPATDHAPAHLAAPVTVSGIPGAQIGPGGAVWITAPEYGPDGKVTNAPEADARRTFTIRVENRGQPRHAPEVYDAIIAAADLTDPAFAKRLQVLGAGIPYGPEGNQIEPPQGRERVSFPALIFHLWAAHGVASDDPVLGPIRTLAGVSLLMGEG